jgi:hypothetical protein
MEVCGKFYTPGKESPVINFIGGWLSRRARLNAVEEKETPASSGNGITTPPLPSTVPSRCID